jgi:hypothetical protein
MGVASFAVTRIEGFPFSVVMVRRIVMIVCARELLVMMVVVRDLVVTIAIVFLGCGGGRWQGWGLFGEVIVDAAAFVIVRKGVKSQMKRGNADRSRQHHEERGESEIGRAKRFHLPHDSKTVRGGKGHR